jgi:general stress protein YciG
MASTHGGSGGKGASKGGNFANDPERAAQAGKKGGQHSHDGGGKTSKDGNFATDHEKASEAGKKGGERSHRANE